MTSLIFLIFGLSLLIWILIGYSKSRRLNLKLAEYFCIGIGDRILIIIDGDHVPWIFSVVPIPPGFKHIWPKLKWWEWVDGKGKMNEKIINHQTGKEEAKYKEIKTFPSAPDGFMGQREEFVPSIRKFEPTGYNIEVRTLDGYLVNIILPLVYCVFDPYKVVRYALFKMVGELEANNAIRTWAAVKTVQEIQKTNINEVSAISVKNPDTTKPDMDLETYLDEVHFKKLGFEIDKKGLVIILSAEAKEFFDLVNKNKVIQQEGENAKAKLVARTEELKVELAEETQETNLFEARITAVGKGFEEIVDKIYKGKALVAAQHPWTLVEVKHEEDEIGEKLVEGFLSKIPSVESTIFKKKNKKEAPDEETA